MSARKTVPFTKEAVTTFLDHCIQNFRKYRGDILADHHIEAYQRVREALFGEQLPDDETEFQHARRELMANTTKVFSSYEKARVFLNTLWPDTDGLFNKGLFLTDTLENDSAVEITFNEKGWPCGITVIGDM